MNKNNVADLNEVLLEKILGVLTTGKVISVGEKVSIGLSLRGRGLWAEGSGLQLTFVDHAEWLDNICSISVNALEVRSHKSRVFNGLRNANILIIGDLVRRRTESGMLRYRNFGLKSYEALQTALHLKDVSVGMCFNTVPGPQETKAIGLWGIGIAPIDSRLVELLESNGFVTLGSVMLREKFEKEIEKISMFTKDERRFLIRQFAEMFKFYNISWV